MKETKQMKLNLQTAKSAMRVLAEGAPTSLGVLDIAEGDLKLTMGEQPWTGHNRARVVRTLESLILGSLDIIGIDRFEVPAEYTAAGIGMFVHPTNIMVATTWLQGGTAAATMANPNSEQVHESVKAPQLFALVLGLRSNDDCCQFKDRFCSRVGIKMQQHKMKTSNNPLEGKSK